MRESLPSKLLLQLLEATPEKLAAVERILDGEASLAWQPRPALANEASRAALPESADLDHGERSFAAKVLGLLTALDPDNRLRKAPPIKVFNIYYRQQLAPAEIARICKCDRSLIFDRLAAIREKIPWSLQQLQEVSPHIEAMNEALTDSRAECIYRKGAAYGNDYDDERDE